MPRGPEAPLWKRHLALAYTQDLKMESEEVCRRLDVTRSWLEKFIMRTKEYANNSTKLEDLMACAAPKARSGRPKTAPPKPERKKKTPRKPTSARKSATKDTIMAASGPDQAPAPAPAPAPDMSPTMSRLDPALTSGKETQQQQPTAGLDFPGHQHLIWPANNSTMYPVVGL